MVGMGTHMEKQHRVAQRPAGEEDKEGNSTEYTHVGGLEVQNLSQKSH